MMERARAPFPAPRARPAPVSVSAPARVALRACARTTVARMRIKTDAVPEDSRGRATGRRYAGLFFTLCVDVNDNELGCLEAIHLFVEVLDQYFGNVCELDLVFNFHKVGGARTRSRAHAH